MVPPRSAPPTSRDGLPHRTDVPNPTVTPTPETPMPNRRRTGRLLLPLLLVLGSAPAAARAEKLPPLETVPHVDLARYMGTWYDIASFPQRFQRGCTNTTATYTLREDGTVEVLNRCARSHLEGKLTAAKGRAKVVDRASNARLKVSFFWPFWGDYWIIDLGQDYEYAVVGHPNRSYLWILSRAPAMAPEVYEGILERLRRQRYDVTRLVKTPQAAA